MGIGFFIAVTFFVYIKLPLAIRKAVLSEEYLAHPPSLFTRFYTFFETLMLSFGFIYFLLCLVGSDFGTFMEKYEFKSYLFFVLIFILSYFHRSRYYWNKYEYYSMEIFQGALLGACILSFFAALNIKPLITLSVYAIFIFLKLFIYRNVRKNYLTTAFKKESSANKFKTLLWAFLGFYVTIFLGGVTTNRMMAVFISLIPLSIYVLYLYTKNTKKEIRKDCIYHDKKFNTGC